MFKGFYNLTSGVLTHQRNLDVIANNMTNISTPGYKQTRYTATTFDEVMYSRVGNKDSKGPEIGKQSYIRATSEITTDFTQGALQQTGYPLDFAIEGKGFFAIETLEGETGYTRSGNFSLDDMGYLCMPGIGYVLDPDGQRIQLETDKIFANSEGVIYTEDGMPAARLGLVDFPEETNLDDRSPMGLILAENGQPAENCRIHHGYVERSNTDAVKQMTEMITYQRSLQSAASVMKMYDNLMTKATGEIGKM